MLAMKKTSPINLLGFTVATVLLLSAVAVAQEKGKTDEDHPAGYIDPGDFLDFADEDREGKMVEILIEGPLLRIIAKSFEEEQRDKQLAAFLNKLERISSLVITPKHSARLKAGVKLIEKKELELTKAGWGRLARLRAPDFQSVALMHSSAEDTIDGLVVMTVESDKLIFSNLAGEIDLASLGRLQSTLSIPGLKGLPEEIEKQGKDNEVGSRQPQQDPSTTRQIQQPETQPSTKGSKGGAP